MTEYWIEWDIRPFYRRWRGWKYLAWWLWPVRWALVSKSRCGCSWNYFTTANDAAIALARKFQSKEKEQDR